MRSGDVVGRVAGVVVDVAVDVPATVVDVAGTVVVVEAALVGGADDCGTGVVVGACRRDGRRCRVWCLWERRGRRGVRRRTDSSAATSVVGGSVGGDGAASTRLGPRTVTAATINANRACARARAPIRTVIPPSPSAVGHLAPPNRPLWAGDSNQGGRGAQHRLAKFSHRHVRSRRALNRRVPRSPALPVVTPFEVGRLVEHIAAVHRP